MSIGRLAWRTPTGAMLWEIWGRQKFLIILQAGALVASAVIAQFAGGFSRDASELFIPLSYQAGGLSLLLTVACFCHMEIDARRLQAGFPSYLLIKPVATVRLVSLPMFCGGIAVIAVFLTWVALVWRQVGFPTASLPWFCAVLFSCTWCIQAIAWSTANLPWGCQAALMLLAVGVNALVGLMPGLLEMGNGWRLGIIGAMLAGSFALAVVGVQRVRRGAWESGGITFRTQRVDRQKRKAFRSAFRAQFWLEWRRQGWTLPIFTGLGLIVIIGLVDFGLRFISRKWGGAAEPADSSDRLLILNYAILAPIFCSGALNMMMANFDITKGTDAGLPVYVAIRPMTNGALVIAKLAMAAASSAMAWLVVLGLLLVWLVAVAGASVGTGVWRVLVSQPNTILIFLSSLLLLTLLTWRNLVAGIWVGLSGRPKLIVGFVSARIVVYFALGVIGVQAGENLEFRIVLFHWLPWILSVGIIVKILGSAVAFRWGLRQKAITGNAIAWMTWTWVGCGLFVTLLVKEVSAGMPMPIAWPWIALAGCLLLPLADLAIAPLALRWNRHR